jgi:hypothetical protein
MSTVSPLGMFLWYLGIVLLGAVVILLARRRLYREFPVFGVYVIFQFASAVVGLWAWNRFGIHLLSEVYNFGEFMDAILSMALVLEIFSKTLNPYPGIRRVGIVVYTVAGCVLSSVAIWMAAIAPTSEIAKIATHFVVLERSAQFVRVGLLFLLFLFCRFFGLSWRHYLFGIALGLAIATSVEALNNSLRIQFGWDIVRIYVIVAPLSFDLGVLTWVYYLVASESKVRITQLPQSAQLARWNTALEELLAR